MNVRADTDTHALAAIGSSIELECNCGRIQTIGPAELAIAPARDIRQKAFRCPTCGSTPRSVTVIPKGWKSGGPDTQKAPHPPGEPEGGLEA